MMLFLLCLAGVVVVVPSAIAAIVWAVQRFDPCFYVHSIHGPDAKSPSPNLPPPRAPRPPG